MPGIVGLVTRLPRAVAEPQLLAMVETLRHESFYATGTWVDETLGVYVGWVARKGSFADGMPLRGEDGSVVLIVSGEEFSPPGTAGGLRARGHALDDAPASYLVHLAEDDRSFPASLNGRFHGLLADHRQRTVTLFNDRYGMHRLYYHDTPDAFYFAAEAKAILAVRPECRKLDARGLAEFVACGCVLEDRSLFAGVGVLPAGSAWALRAGAPARRTAYFDRREWVEQPPLEPETYYETLREAFPRIVAAHFSGPEPVAMSLTGGLDTRMIMAWHRAAPGTLGCYTFGGMVRDCRDVVVARAVARACGQSHEVIPLGQEFLSRFPRYAERTVYLTDGAVDVRHAPDLCANERARDIAPVRMTGNYGGEVLRGVRAFSPRAPRAGLFAPDLHSGARHAAETCRTLATNTHPVAIAAFRQAPWRQYGLLALEQTQVAVRTPFLDDTLVRIAFRAPPSAARHEACARLIADGDPALARIWTDLGPVGGAAGARATVAAGVLRFLKKAEYAWDYGMPHWFPRVERRLGASRLDRLLLGRHKFAHFRVWYRDALAPFVRDVLLDPRALSRAYVERRGLRAIVEAHTRGTGNYTTEIHTMLTLEFVHRLLLDG